MLINNREVDEIVDSLNRLIPLATPGKWWIDSHGHGMIAFDGNNINEVFETSTRRPAVRHEDTGNLSHWRNDNDATYIATANPDSIKTLLGELHRRTSESNAWRVVRDEVSEISGHAGNLREAVSYKLHADGCHSSAIHVVEFIKALIQENADLREELDNV